MNATPTPAEIHRMYANGEFIQAHASALALYAQRPDSYEIGLLFLQTALCIERADSVIAVLQDIAEGIPAQTRHLLLFQAHMLNGDYAASWQHLAQTGLAKDSPAFHDCAFRIASQEHDLCAALEHLNSLERQLDRPLSHFFKKFEILKQQGRNAEIAQQITFLQQSIPGTATIEHQQLLLWRAGTLHNQHDFLRSILITTQLIADFVISAPSKPITNAAQLVKPWTRRRQHQVIKDLERLIVMHQFPLFMVAGSLLSLVREGDFFLSDKDIDLGLLDGDFAQVIALLVKSRYFQDVSPPDYFVGYSQLRHRSTGFIVDVTRYHSKDEHIYATWGHTSGEALRQTRFTKFSLHEAFFPSLRCRLLIPDQTDSYLTSMYGDWRTPDPHFDTVVAACNLCEFTPFLHSLSFIKIADALQSQRFVKAKASIKHLHDCGFSSPLLDQLQSRLHDFH